MSEIIRSHYVNQRQYGVIAPERDSNGVNSLVTSGLYPCFGVAIFDKISNIGMFTHLDYVEDLLATFETASPALENLGANLLTVLTVNIDSPHLNPHGGQVIVNRRKRGLDQLVETLIHKSLSDNAGWIDIGVSKAAVFEPKRGITAATIDQLRLTREQLVVAHNYQSRLYEITKQNNGNSRALAISCAYEPAEIVIKTY